MCSYHFFIVRSHSPIPTIPIKTLIYPPQNRSLAQPAWCEGHLSISVARTPPQRLLTDTLQLWGPARVSPWDARCRLRVTFSGEPAVDAGGPFREWLVALSQALVTATTGDPEKAHPRFEPSSWSARGGGRSSSGLGRSTTRVIAGVEYERANDRVGWSRVRRDADVESLLAGGGSSDDSDNDDDEFRDDTMSDDDDNDTLSTDDGMMVLAARREEAKQERSALQEEKRDGGGGSSRGGGRGASSSSATAWHELTSSSGSEEDEGAASVVPSRPRPPQPPPSPVPAPAPAASPVVVLPAPTALTAPPPPPTVRLNVVTFATGSLGIDINTFEGQVVVIAARGFARERGVAEGDVLALVGGVDVRRHLEGLPGNNAHHHHVLLQERLRRRRRRDESGNGKGEDDEEDAVRGVDVDQRGYDNSHWCDAVKDLVFGLPRPLTLTFIKTPPLHWFEKTKQSAAMKKEQQLLLQQRQEAAS